MRFDNHLYVMRHGQSENNVLEIESCHLETQLKYGLTELGIEQTQAAAQTAPRFDCIYTSPFRRAQETAQIVAEVQGLSPIVEPLLREYNMAHFDERPYSEAEIFIQNPDNNLNHTPIPGGDSFDTVHERMTTALSTINQAPQETHILIVSHGAPIEASIQIAKGINTGFDPFAELPKNAEITHLNSISLLT